MAKKCCGKWKKKGKYCKKCPIVLAGLDKVSEKKVKKVKKGKKKKSDKKKSDKNSK